MLKWMEMRKWTAMRNWMAWHKWLALLVAVQLLLWLLSGLGLSLLDEDLVRANASQRAPDAAVPLVQLSLTDPAPLLASNVVSLASTQLLGRPYYLVTYASSSAIPAKLFNARSLKPVQIDSEFARALALNRYAGDGKVSTVEYLSADQHPVVFAPYDLWQIRFDDELGTEIYLDPRNGRIATVRNRIWWWHELFLTLHFMDFTGSGKFNHVWTIALAWLTLGLTFSGAWLVLKQLRMGQYRPRKGSRSRAARL